jgi:DIS3-like exonuclease 2
VDIYVGGMIDRNRAFNGDRVAVKLYEPNKWKQIKQNDKTVVQKTGKIVHILKENHPRLAGGHLQQMKDKSQNWALFVPNDSRVPRMKIPMKDCPQGFLQHPQHFTHSLFIAKLDEWKNLNSLPNGILVKHLGNSGDIEAESELILTENNIEFIDFPEEAFIGLPDISDNNEWTIPETEIHSRRDLRKECVFTIDPSTARDLDDALSVKRLDDELFEIGVHIADVSYFVKEGMPLDEIARRRTTSVYLVQKVIPMLPRILCEKLCSLNPGEDKLTFSVVWTINKDGHILEEWFGRTIINSCIKLSYELAQDMIDEPNREWKQNELPNIYGNWSHKEISESVNLLNEIALKLRKARFDSGALKIDKLKLHFVLDNETGLPSGFSPYIYRDSNRLVEEFMLLANMAVAHQTYKTFDEKAFLRSHPPPGENQLNEFKSFCKYNNFQVDTSSSLALQQSLNAIIDDNPNISKVVALFLLKAMQMATYLCVGVQNASASFHHYALNVPLYTHFTSPIRRYADVIVHRLLAASLSYRSLIKDSVKDLHRLAQKCNEMKMNARIVSENSARLFLNIYIKQIGKMEEKAVVVQVYDHSFDVMLLNCGVICRVYLDQLPLKEFIFEPKQGKNQVILKWNNDSNANNKLDSDILTQTITACLIVKVQVSVNEDDSTKLNVSINLLLYNKTNCQKLCFFKGYIRRSEWCLST